MASVSRDPNGNYTVRVICGDQVLRSIRLGKVSKKAAEAVRQKVEHLNAAAITRLPLDRETAEWVASIGSELASKLAKAELIPERTSRTL